MRMVEGYRVDAPALRRDGMVYWAGEQYRSDCALLGIEYREPSMLMSGWDSRVVTLRDHLHRVLAVYCYGVDRDGCVWFEAQ